VDLYRLWRPIARHNLDELAHVLLAEMLEGKDAASREEVLSRLAQRLLPPVRTEIKNLTQRLTQTVQYLNRMNYQARWEAHAQGPRVIFQHCPYQAIVEKHPEVCLIDQLLLRNLLRLPVQQSVKKEMTTMGIQQCIFRLGEIDGFS
jgi:predicted ArsR family transcriptional regulator